MTTPKIVHLIDDATAGGVMRMLDHLVHLPDLSGDVQQSVRQVKRNALSFGRINADVIVSHLTISWRGLPALMTLRAMHPDARIIHVEHSYTRAFTALNVSAKRRFFALLRVAYSLFDRVVAVSNTQANWLSERKLVETAALCVIQPEVDLSEFSGLNAPTSQPRVIGAIGRLEPQKGFDVLIEAFRMCPRMDARLLVVGEGSERTTLEALAKGDPRITFLGHSDDPVEAFAKVDAVAIPSRWEAFGIVAREALAAKRQIIVSDIDGLSDLTSAHFAGDLQVKTWAKALETVFSGKNTQIEPAVSFNNGQSYASLWKRAFFEDPTSWSRTGGTRRRARTGDASLAINAFIGGNPSAGFV